MTKTEKFIQKAKLVHGDKYDYSKVEYINSSTKVVIICPKHGDFEQLPGNHLKCGCFKCGVEYKANKRKDTTEIFIEKARKIHGDKYDYSKVEYVNNSTKVIIICPEHGEFKQQPSNHLMGKIGCEKCHGHKKLTTDEFIQKAKLIHGDKYDYSKVEYINSSTKVVIICPKHGDFEQLPYSHLNGAGCANCAGCKKSTTEEYIRKAILVHGNKYDYSKVNYINAKTNIIINCPIHKEFKQNPNNHLNGNGCPNCASKIEFLPFEEARTFVRNINLKNSSAWQIFCKSKNKPDNIPNDPYSVYKNNGWISFGDWLGTNFIATQNRSENYLSIEEFQQFIQDTFPNVPTEKLSKAYEAWWDENKPDNLPKDVANYYNK